MARQKAPSASVEASTEDGTGAEAAGAVVSPADAVIGAESTPEEGEDDGVEDKEGEVDADDADEGEEGEDDEEGEVGEVGEAQDDHDDEAQVAETPPSPPAAHVEL